MESEVQRLKVELDEVQAKLKSTAVELSKTQARNKTMERHEHVRIILLQLSWYTLEGVCRTWWRKSCLYLDNR